MKLIKFAALLCTPIALFSCGGNKKNCTVTFDLNGGYGDFSTLIVVEGTYINDPGVPKHDNTPQIRFTFDYWSCNGTKYEFHTTPITQDTTLKAEWKETERIYHQVSFDTDGGEPTIDSMEVEDGFTMDPPETIPTKAKDVQYTYTFKEWQLDGKTFDFEKTPITGNIELKAKYTETLNKYTVTFNSDGGSDVKSQDVEYGGYATEPSAPTKPSVHDYNYEFEYWMDSNENKFEFTTTQITGPITLKAKWKAIERVYWNVSYNTDGGTPAIDPVEVESGHTTTAPKTIPTKEPSPQYTYTFKEWQLDGETFDFANTPITANITLKAKYTETVNKYTVTFNTDGGSSIESQEVEYNGHATKPETDPTKQTDLYNYPFVRWEDKEGNEFDFENTPITAATTVYAKWDSPVEWWSDTDYINGLTTDNVGITRGVTVNSKIHKVRLIGIDHDTIANSNSTAHTTWEFATIFSNSSGNAETCSWERNGHYYHASDDYINSGIRKGIDGGGTADKSGWESEVQFNVLSKLPSTLQSNLKTITKYVYTQPSGGGGTLSSYSASLFQLSLLEMGYYDSTHAETTNVSRYDYYSDATGETSSKRIKYDYNGNAKKVWLRSPYRTTGQYDTWDSGWVINTDGKVDDEYLALVTTIHYYAVAPAFCL